MDTSRPFRTREATAEGAPTRGRLAGPSFRAVFRGAHVDASVDDDLLGRARAACRLVPGAVLGGYTAAELWGADIAPRGAPVELVVGRHRVRDRSGMRCRQDALREDEVLDVAGLPVTSAPRTAFDLVRREAHEDAVVALDALARVGRFDPAELLTYVGARSRARGVARLGAVVADADPLAESRPETLTRLGLVAHGVPRPDLQIRVHDLRGVEVARVDMGWRWAKLAVEYQGDHHRVDPRQYRRDQVRAGALAAAGWLVIPATSFVVLQRPDILAEQVLEALATRST